MKFLIAGIIISIILIFVLILLFIKGKKDKIKDIVLKIDEADDVISRLLKKKGESILTIDEIIEEKSDKTIVENKDDIKENNITKHDLNKALNDYYDSIIETVEYNNEVILDDEETEELNKLKNITLDLIGVEKYYNENLTKLNKYAKSFPTSIFTSNKKREPYVNEKSEIFEILKD